MKDYTLFVPEWATPETVAILDDKLNVVPNYVFEKILVTDESENEITHVVRLRDEQTKKTELFVAQGNDLFFTLTINEQKCGLYIDIDALRKSIYEAFPSLNFCKQYKKYLQPNDGFDYIVQNLDGDILYLIEQSYVKDSQCVLYMPKDKFYSAKNSDLVFSVNMNEEDFNIFSFFRHIYRKYLNGMLDYFFDGAIVEQKDILHVYSVALEKQLTLLFTFENVLSNQYSKMDYLGQISMIGLTNELPDVFVKDLSKMVFNKYYIDLFMNDSLLLFHRKDRIGADVANYNKELLGEADDSIKTVRINMHTSPISLSETVVNNLNFLYGENI